MRNTVLNCRVRGISQGPVLFNYVSGVRVHVARNEDHTLQCTPMVCRKLFSFLVRFPVFSFFMGGGGRRNLTVVKKAPRVLDRPRVALLMEAT